ncbi:hypothetical protein DMJ13_22465 [halophilic archaeon]|nr:hypothetical protein DMJ13_22465 [halophilic archaeon]
MQSGFQTDGGETTAAETNPKYPADNPLIIVAFETDLDGHWEGWRDADSHSLFDGVCENGVHHYGFPEGRLAFVESEPADDSERAESPEEDSRMPMPQAFPDIAECLEQSEFAVAYDPSEEGLRVEKFGIEHAIEHDGTIRGESGMKSRVSVIVSRFM